MGITANRGSSSRRESRRATGEFFDVSPDILVTANGRGYFESVNDSAVALLGYSRAELLSRPYAEFVEPEDVERTLEATARLAAATNLVNIENRYRCRDGTIRWLSWNCKAVGDVFYCAARDVTEVRRAAAESERLAAAVESATDAILTKDRRCLITSWNAGAEQLYGYTEAEVLGRDVALLVPPDREGESRRNLDRILAGERIFPYETRRVAKGGREIEVSVSLAPIRDESGTIIGASSMARDITAEAEVRRQLADQQAYNRGLIEASIDGLVTIDREMMITDVNETMCRMLALTREELVGSRFSDHCLEREHAMAGVRGAFDAGRVTDHELTLQTAGGRLLPVSFNAGVYATADGEPAGILAAARDVSSYKVLQQRLFEAQYYTRSLIESSIDPMMTTDPSGIITDVNRQMERLTGRTREQLIGSPCRAYFTQPELADRGIERTLRDGSVANLELTPRSADGVATVVSYNATTFADRDGAVRGVFATARDVTEFKRLEQELRELSRQLERRVEERTRELAAANARLEVANRELEAFSYSVSHDLRAPLRAIDGFSRALSTRYGDQLDDPGRQMIERVRAGTVRMGELIDSMLTLSRLSRRELKLAPIDLSAMARPIVDELRMQAPERDVEVAIEDGLTAVADADLARTALRNLLDNAWKFTSKREHARIELARSPPEDGGGFVIRDNGAGFDMAFASKLFGPFERLHRADEFPGTGIGLTTVQRIVRRHGGDIRAEGIVDRGASFFFGFGANEASAPSGGPVTATTNGGA